MPRLGGGLQAPLSGLGWPQGDLKIALYYCLSNDDSIIVTNNKKDNTTTETLAETIG